jgi:predicted alpha/beta superfamily hydrolase
MRLGNVLTLGFVLLALGAPATVAGEALILGQRFVLHSAALGEERSYQVHRPPDYDITTARYPVLYVTDGNEHFQHVSATVDFLAAAGRIPPMIVIGIPNTNRFRDLLGYTKEPGPSALLKFITSELAPKIDADNRTLPYRMLMGWSDGGLFALHALMNAPDAFRSYLVLAAAIGDDQSMPKALGAFFDAHPGATLNADMYMGMDDVTGRSLGWAYETASVLQQRAGRVRDLRFTFRYYADESHGAVPLRGVQDGLQIVFDGWELADPFALYEQGGLAAIEKHYTALSGRLGFPVAVPEDALFAAFNGLEGRRRYSEAVQVIARAVALHPQNATALYYLARVQGRMGDKPQALETLKKLLLMAPGDGGARALLREMQVDPDTLAVAASVPSKELAKYTGRYGNPAVFVIEQRGEKLHGRTAEREYALTPLSATQFRYAESNVYSSGGSVEFRIDTRGRVTGLMFGNGGPELARSK